MDLQKNEIALYWQASKNGDQQAFRKLFDLLYPSLVSTAYRYVQSEDLAKDFAQEAFLELWKRRQQLDIQISVSAYLSRTVVNKSLNHLKSSKRIDYLGEAPEPLGASEMMTAQEKMEQEEEYQELYQAIDQLPDRCRVIFVMSRFEELSHKEIASKLDISTKTIESQITRAFKMLRKSLLRMSVLLSFL